LGGACTEPNPAKQPTGEAIKSQYAPASKSGKKAKRRSLIREKTDPEKPQTNKKRNTKKSLTKRGEIGDWYHWKG